MKWRSVDCELVAGISGIWQCGLQMENWNDWKWKMDVLEWGGMETNKSDVKYEANVSELACDELNLSLLSANLKAYLLKKKLNRFPYLLNVNDWVNNVMT